MSDRATLLMASAGYIGGVHCCDVCKHSILPGQQILVLIREKYPFKCEDAEDQDYDVFEWHQACDPGTIAAEDPMTIERKPPRRHGMKLNWKSYGDTGRTADGNQGHWYIVTDGRWWHLTIQPENTGQKLNRGKFTTRQNAEIHAQDRENNVSILPRTTVPPGVDGANHHGDTE